MLRVNDKVKVHMMNYPQPGEIITGNYDHVFTVQRNPRTGKVCIDWYREGNEHLNDGSPFADLEAFSWTVIFENVETGERCYYDTIRKKLSPPDALPLRFD